MTGKSMTDFIDELRALPVEKISSYIQEHESYFIFFTRKRCLSWQDSHYL